MSTSSDRRNPVEVLADDFLELAARDQGLGP